jgi:hypothetical protein
VRRAVAALAILWVAALGWAGLARPSWQPHRRSTPAGVAARSSGPGWPPPGRPSPLPAARAAVVAAPTAEGAARLGGCEPEPASLVWAGPGRATVELSCPAVLTLPGGEQLAVARTWTVVLGWTERGWTPLPAGP